MDQPALLHTSVEEFTVLSAAYLQHTATTRTIT